MTENSTQVVFDSPTTAIFLDLEMLDQLYTCVATATGFDSYNRTGLFNELSDAAHPGHNYAAYLASCAVLFLSLSFALLGIYFSRFVACVVGLYIGGVGALLLDGLFLPRSDDSSVDCLSLELTVFAAALFVGAAMLMFNKAIYIFAGLIAGEITGGAVFNLFALDPSSAGAREGRLVLMGFCAVIGAVAMYAMGDRVWMLGTAVVGAWYATISFVEVVLVPYDMRYQDFIRHGPNVALAVDHLYTTLTELLTNRYLRYPLLLFVVVAFVGVQTQKALWASSRKRSVTGKGQGQVKQGEQSGKPAPSGSQAAVMM